MSKPDQKQISFNEIYTNAVKLHLNLDTQELIISTSDLGKELLNLFEIISDECKHIGSDGWCTQAIRPCELLSCPLTREE